MQCTATTPNVEHIFEVIDNPQLLDEGVKQYFHTMNYNILFLSKRARTDLQEAVAFLMKKMKVPDIYDNKNLGEVIKYLRGGQKRPLPWRLTTHIY